MPNGMWSLIMIIMIIIIMWHKKKLGLQQLSWQPPYRISAKYFKCSYSYTFFQVACSHLWNCQRISQYRELNVHAVWSKHAIGRHGKCRITTHNGFSNNLHYGLRANSGEVRLPVGYNSLYLRSSPHGSVLQFHASLSLHGSSVMNRTSMVIPAEFCNGFPPSGSSDNRKRQMKK